MMITDWIIAFLTLVIALFSILVWRVYRRLAWLTGAMESHSTLMLGIEAKRGVNNQPIKIIWWDPTIEEPPFTGEHGKEANLESIFMFMPPQYRKYKSSWFSRLKDSLS